MEQEKNMSNEYSYKKLKLLLKKIVEIRAWVLLLIFLGVVSRFDNNFLTISNILNVLRQTSVNAIISAGMTMVILTAGIDLGVGSVLAISGAIGVTILVYTGSLFLGVISIIFVGILCGCFNGFLVSFTKLQPFIVTLISMVLLRGVVMVFSNGHPIGIGSGKASDLFYWLGSGSIGGIPMPIYIMVLVYIVIWYIQSQTKLGRYIYVIGNNEKAAILAGIGVRKVKFIVYIISGICSAIASIILTARLSSASPVVGQGYELDAIAAVVVGGTGLLGGKGSVVGTLAGSLLIAVLSNSLNILNVSAYYQMIVKGLVILCAVLLDVFLEKGMKKFR